MSWQRNGDVIVNKRKEVCKLQKDIDPFFSSIIKNGDYALSLMEKFTVQRYDKKKMISKALFNEICDLVTENRNYDFKWSFNNNGDIETDDQTILCTFPMKGTQDARLIRYLPEIFLNFQKLVTSYKSSKPIHQKSIYDEFCRIQEKISDI